MSGRSSSVGVSGGVSRCVGLVEMNTASVVQIE